MISKTIFAAAVATLVLSVPAEAKAPPTLWISEAKLTQKKLVYKISPRVPHDSRSIGPCIRVSRLAVDCTAEFHNTEVAGNEKIETVRKFKITVRRTAEGRGYRTSGEIIQVSYQEA